MDILLIDSDIPQNHESESHSERQQEEIADHHSGIAIGRMKRKRSDSDFGNKHPTPLKADSMGERDINKDGAFGGSLCS